MTEKEAWDLYRIKIDPIIGDDDEDRAIITKLVQDCESAVTFDLAVKVLKDAHWGDPTGCAEIIRGLVKPKELRCPNCDGKGVV